MTAERGSEESMVPFSRADTVGGGDGDGDRPTGPVECVPYRHDVHKLRGRSHAAAGETVDGVPVNESVPLAADRDASLLSRPRGEPEQTVANHRSPYRLSLVSGATAASTPGLDAVPDGGITPLISPGDAEELHARWLTGAVPAAYNESVYYPYTSLQYHTLLVAAILDNYRAGHDFEELHVVATSITDADQSGFTAAAARAADAVVPHRTVLWTSAFALHVTATPGDRPSVRVGETPARSFADAWSRLPAHPIETAGDVRWRRLDAELRRIRSWSTALAYIDDYVTVYGAGPGGVSE